MGYKHYKKHIEREIDALNLLIDEKIMHGLSYRKEAKRHKDLIRWARRNRQPSFMTRMATVLSLF